MEGGDPGRDLPAPYEDPWKLLRRDLRAVVASLRLRLWELGRRNRDGDLPRPGFWPAGLAAWFWPLVLLGALALVLATGLALGWSPGQPPLTSEAQLEVSATAEPELAAPDPTPIAVPDTAAEPAQDAGVEGPEPSAPEPMPPADPLLEAFASGDAASVVQAVRSEPARAELVLLLEDGWRSLPAGLRDAQAKGWLQQCQSLGYEQLTLMDGQQRLLGYSARVGSGMILLDPDWPRDAA